MKTIIKKLLVLAIVKIPTLWLLSIVAFMLSGCVKAMTPAITDQTFLPGESLNGNDLLFIGQSEISHYGAKKICLSFELNLDYVRETLDYIGHYESSYRFAPTDEAFSQFGDNADSVKKEYEKAWQYEESGYDGIYYYRHITTIFYDSGISLVANKDFAGVTAGENITDNPPRYDSHDVTGHPTQLYFGFNPTMIKLDGDFSFNYCLEPRINILIDETGYAVVDENVTFTLSIPVKVGLYLTWLNDKISDPDAPFPYREETLTCTFTIHKGLR